MEILNECIGLRKHTQAAAVGLPRRIVHLTTRRFFLRIFRTRQTDTRPMLYAFRYGCGQRNNVHGPFLSNVWEIVQTFKCQYR